MTILEIQTQVAKDYGITMQELLSDSRAGTIMKARRAAIYLTRALTDKSLPQIGQGFGRDHSTIISSLRYSERTGFGQEVLRRFSYMGG